jgi:hypothetical protein
MVARSGWMIAGAAALLAVATAVAVQMRTTPASPRVAVLLDCPGLQRLDEARRSLEDLGGACDPRTGACGGGRGPKPLECTPPGPVRVPALSPEQKQRVASGVAQLMAAYGVTTGDVQQAQGK